MLMMLTPSNRMIDGYIDTTLLMAGRIEDGGQTAGRAAHLLSCIYGVHKPPPLCCTVVETKRVCVCVCPQQTWHRSLSGNRVNLLKIDIFLIMFVCGTWQQNVLRLILNSNHSNIFVQRPLLPLFPETAPPPASASFL